MPRNPWPDWKLKPCGTPAAARRHWRRHEPLCEACSRAHRNEQAARGGHDPGVHSFDHREIRNGLPDFVPYIYRGTGYDQLTGEAS